MSASASGEPLASSSESSKQVRKEMKEKLVLLLNTVAVV